MYWIIAALALTNVVTLLCLMVHRGWSTGIQKWFAVGRRGEVLPFTSACALAQAALWFMTIITVKTAILIVITCLMSVCFWEKSRQV